MTRSHVIDVKKFVFAALILVVFGACLFLNNLEPVKRNDSLTAKMNIDNSDIYLNWNKYPKFNINLSQTLTIKKSGIYNIYGMLDGGQIVIDVGDEVGKVKLILNGVEIESNNGPAIYVKSADDVIIETAKDTENILSDSDVYNVGDEKINATIYSLGDLTLQGEGKLIINGNYQDGIASKDDLNIRDGSLIVNAKDDAIRGKDSVHITGGDVSISCGQDGIKSTNVDLEDKGFVYIENGTLTISAGDDGVSAITYLLIDDGKINITNSFEGLEAAVVMINAGNISVNSQDDGINASKVADDFGFTDDVEVKLVINGGDIRVNSEGDGLDSNGNLEINGGDVRVNAKVEALDATEKLEIRGGDIQLNGEPYLFILQN